MWSTLSRRFSQPDDSRIYQLQHMLCSVSQGTNSVDAYFIELNSIWKELHNFIPLPHCLCGSSMAVKKGPSSDVICAYCKKPGHTKDKCYKLIECPPDFKFTKPRASNSQQATTSYSNSGIPNTSAYSTKP
ncbi:hypothetical protein RCOM_0537790 [Ricinus communis]|uniref:Retrotransposon gag domain-containing protein n=1 Tax=Ricinus communis TaxID=3988 RepID=B9SVI8_RICCO|nr:hypothetical protein RCOM_0537790 [Ricinus communis]